MTSADGPDDPTHRQAQPPGPTRGPDGKYMNTIENAEYDARAARLRVNGLSYREIAHELGYADHTSAMDAVKRAISAVPVEAGTEARQVELERLDKLVAAATRILERTHLAYNNKGVVEWDGAALEDDAPALAAARVLKDLSESRRRLLGLDAETKVAVSAEVTYQVVGVDPAGIADSDAEPPAPPVPPA